MHNSHFCCLAILTIPSVYDEHTLYVFTVQHVVSGFRLLRLLAHNDCFVIISICARSSNILWECERQRKNQHKNIQRSFGQHVSDGIWWKASRADMRANGCSYAAVRHIDWNRIIEILVRIEKWKWSEEAVKVKYWMKMSLVNRITIAASSLSSKC